jgi:predicted nucleic acid-binding Zn ribbon protein
MARKTVGYVELEWTCPNCGGKNVGSAKNCATCGAPQPDKVQFQQGQNQQALTDTKKIAQAQKGADIHCPYCGTRNPADAQVCLQCGGDLKEGLKRVEGTVVGAFAPGNGPVKEIPCPSCATSNPETNKTCSACGALLNQPPAGQMPSIAATPATGSQKASFFRPWMALPLAAILLGCCVIIGFIFLRTSTTKGVVESVNWERVISIQELRAVTLQAWKSDLPQGADVLSCQEKYRYDQDSPAPGAKEVCGTPYNVDKGNGYAETVQDCHYEIYEDYCKYSAQEWQGVDQKVAQGKDLQPYWPDLVVGASQREGQRTATYTVIFQTDDGLKEFVTEDEQVFAMLEPGTRWTLEIDAFGKIVNVQP